MDPNGFLFFVCDYRCLAADVDAFAAVEAAFATLLAKEAAAHGVPSVTTDLLAKQLGWKHEEQLLVADRTSEFADQCIRLYQNTELWNHVRSTGLRSVSRECSDKKFQTTLKKLLKLQIKNWQPIGLLEIFLLY